MAGTKRAMPFERTGPFPIDDKFVLSKAEMLAVSDTVMPEKYFAVNTDDGKFYLYDKSATASAETGKFSVLEGGGGSGVPAGGTTGQILAKASDDDGDATWVDDQGAFLMAEECEYGSHTETREVEVEYYTWDRSPGATDIPVITNRKLRSTDAKYDPATFASSNADTIAFLFQRLYNNKNQSRLLLNSKVVEVDNPNPSLFGAYYFFTFRCGGTTYYVRTSTNDAKSGVFVKNNMFTQEPPFAALDAVDVSAIYSYGTGDYYEVYTRHTRTETREVEVPDYIHNVSCIVKNDLNLDPRTIPSGWGIAAKDVVQIPNNGGEWGEATIDVSKYGFTSADDYSASLLVAGGAGGYGGVNTYIKSKTASSFVIHWARVSGGSATRVDYEYTIIGKGYGNNVSGWGIATSNVIRVNKSSADTQTTIDVSGFGFASGDDYQVVLETVGGGIMDWGSTVYFLTTKTATSFRFTARNASSNQDFVMVAYTIFAKGYGGSGGGGSIDVDTAMSDTSENAVQNKVIKAYVDDTDKFLFVPTDQDDWQDVPAQGAGVKGVELTTPYTYEELVASGKQIAVKIDSTSENADSCLVILQHYDNNASNRQFYGYSTYVDWINGEEHYYIDTVQIVKQTLTDKTWLYHRTSELSVGSDNTFVFDVDSDQFTEDTDNPDGKHYGMTIDSPTYDELLAMLQTDTFVYARLLYNSGNAYETMQLFHNGNSIYGRYFDVEFPQKRLQFASAYVNKRNNGTYFGTYQDYIGGSIDAYTKAETDALLDAKSSFDIATISTAGGGDEVHATLSQDTDTANINYYKTTELPNALNLNIGSDSFRIPTTGYVDEAVGDLTALTTTDQSSAVAAINELDAAVKGLGEPFRVKQWASNTLNVEIPYCTEEIGNGSIPKMVFSIDAVEGADYQIVGMIAYEVFDAESGGNRINCWPVCQFTGNGQKELSVRWMCGGTTRKTAKRISAWVLLKHR